MNWKQRAYLTCIENDNGILCAYRLQLREERQGMNKKKNWHGMRQMPMLKEAHCHYFCYSTSDKPTKIRKSEFIFGIFFVFFHHCNFIFFVFILALLRSCFFFALAKTNRLVSVCVSISREL